MVRDKVEKFVLPIIRIAMGLIFLWAFFDKVFGLGFNTLKENAWINGGSPTYGFLTFATKGPLAGMYQSIAGSVFVDWIFMIGLLLIGICLLLGIGMKIACYSGALMMFLMWSAVLPPEHHPFLDDHIFYILILIILAHTNTRFSLTDWWDHTKLVKKLKFLE